MTGLPGLDLRPVRASDLPAICTFAGSPAELYWFFPRALWPLTPAQLADAVAARSDSTVATLDGEPAAFANFYRWHTDGACAVGNVVVRPDARGRGLARHLMEHMAGLARDRHGARELQVSCFNDNTAGLLLYQRLGYTPFAMEPRDGPTGAPTALIHFRLPLV